MPTEEEYERQHHHDMANDGLDCVKCYPVTEEYLMLDWSEDKLEEDLNRNGFLAKPRIDNLIAEVRRLQKENAIQKVSINDYFKLLGEGLEDCERLIALGKAVEAMEEDHGLIRDSRDKRDGRGEWSYCRLEYENVAEAYGNTPLEALEAVKEKA